MAFHPDGTCIAAGGADSSIKLYDVRSNSLIQYYSAHARQVTSVVFHPSGLFLLSSSHDGTLKVWDLREGQLMYTLHAHEGATHAAAFAPAGDYFASAGADEQVMVWKSNFDRDLADFVIADVRRSKTTTEQGPGVSLSSGVRAGAEPAKKLVPGTLASEPRTAANRPASGAPARKASAAPEATVAAPLHEEEEDEAAALASYVQSAVPLNVAGLPESLALTLGDMVNKLDVLTQNSALMHERMTMSEDRVRSLEDKFVAVLEALSAVRMAPAAVPVPAGDAML